jgi:hypothetical protein
LQIGVFLLMVVRGLLKWYGELVGSVKDTKDYKNKNIRKGLSLTFKQGTRQDYAIQKQ